MLIPYIEYILNLRLFFYLYNTAVEEYDVEEILIISTFCMVVPHKRYLY